MNNGCALGSKNEYSTAINIHRLLANLFYFKLDDSDSFRNSLKSKGEARASTGWDLGYSIGHKARCLNVWMTSSCSRMNAMIFICTPHLERAQASSAPTRSLLFIMAKTFSRNKIEQWDIY
jgi:hypothetical protein